MAETPSFRARKRRRRRSAKRKMMSSPLSQGFLRGSATLAVLLLCACGRRAFAVSSFGLRTAMTSGRSGVDPGLAGTAGYACVRRLLNRDGRRRRPPSRRGAWLRRARKADLAIIRGDPKCPKNAQAVASCAQGTAMCCGCRRQARSRGRRSRPRLK